MDEHKEYAEILRIGERDRDASDKIRGFLYQDLLAINLILSSSKDDKIYVEWVEDIFTESDNTISIFQVKHYPESRLDFQDIYKNMFYQFLKFKLMETEEKEVKTYCLYHSKTHKDIDQTKIKGCIINENDIESINKLDIKGKLEKCSNIDERKDLIFDRVASSDFLNQFHFEAEQKGDIYCIRDIVKNELYSIVVIDESKFQIQNKEDIKEMILAVAIQYIQKSYYKKLEDYKLRCMTKASFMDYMSRIIGSDKKHYTERIKFVVLGYIDKVFYEVLSEIESDDIAKIYKKIYFSTKEFFLDKLETQAQRFKFLNTISTDEYEELNKDKYIENTQFEIEKFLEHKDKIQQFIRNTWKILYNINSENFGEFIRENNESFFFEFPVEKAKPVIIFSPGNDSKREASKTLSRVSKMKLKPKKWYFRGKLRGKYEYSFDVNKIREAELDGQFSVLCKERDCFKIECMDCIKFDEGEMEIKDKNLKNCIFDYDCIKENNDGTL